MGNKLIDALYEIKDSQEPALVSFFNNGEVKVEDMSALEALNKFNNKDSVETITKAIKRAAESYSRKCKYDRLELFLDLGLVYRKEDVDDNNQVLENAQPLKNIVRYYTPSIKSYLEDVQTNPYDMYGYGFGYDGYLKYNEFIELMEKEGLTFTGPETFDDFKKAILNKEKFDIILEADLRKKIQPKRLTKLF